MSIDVNVQNDLVIVTESSEDITVNVSNAAGPAGVGVPVGGSTGQVLKKLSGTNYDTYWALDAGGVPYSGATGDVDLGEFELKAGQVEFDQTPSGAAGVGVMRWNDSDGTVELGLKGGNVTLQVGQEQILRVVNKTGADLLESQYKAVRIRLAAEGGSQGQRLAVVLAQGNNDVNSTDTIGIVTENITDNQEGFICTSGIVRGINTTGSLQGETWADGDVIYLSPTTAGAITKVKPTAPNHSVVLGYVIYAHNVNGKIFVKCETGYEIGELHDCYLPTPSNNDGIFWNSTNLRYENKTVAGALGFTPISGSGATGQVAYWNGTGSQTGSSNLTWDNANIRLGIGATPASGNMLHVGGNTFSNTFSTNGGLLLNRNGDEAYFQFQRDGSATAQLRAINGGGFRITASAATTEWARFFSTGNFGINTGSTDSGQRLQVNGDAFIKGSGATSATNALLVQNSAGTAMLTLRNDGLLRLQKSYLNLSSSQEYVGISASNDGFNLLSTGLGLMYFSEARTSAGVNHCFYGANVTNISGIVNHIQTSGGGGGAGAIKFAPTSGTGQFNTITLAVTIDQTGGANGVTRGLVVQPTLTSAADWRSIEFTNSGGWGIYGSGSANNYLAGRLLIKTSTIGTFDLDVNGTARVSGATTLAGVVAVNSTNVSTGYALFVNGIVGATGLTLTDELTIGENFAIKNNGSQTIDIDSNNNSTNAVFRVMCNGQTVELFRVNESGNFMLGTSTEIASAKLVVDSTTQGLLPPRMTTTQKNAISSPAAGLMVFDTTLSKLCVYSGTAWETITSI